MGNQLLSSLNTRKGNFAHLLRIEATPFLAMKSVVKRLDMLRPGKVNKCIPNVALVLEVNRKVDKVKMSSVLVLQSTE